MTAVSNGVDSSKPFILLAEDDAILRYTLSLAISKAGYHVIEAVDGLDALERAAEFDGCIRVLVTDIRCPEWTDTSLRGALGRRDQTLR